MPNGYYVSYTSFTEKAVEFWNIEMKLLLIHNYPKSKIISKIHMKILDFNKLFIYKLLVIFIDHDKILL